MVVVLGGGVFWMFLLCRCFFLFLCFCGVVFVVSPCFLPVFAVCGEVLWEVLLATNL